MKKWHTKARKFYREAKKLYDFDPDEELILRAGVNHLSMYWKASDQVDIDGLTVECGQMIRKHPSIETARIAWSGFIQACKLLDIGQPEKQINRVGRPDGGRLTRN